MSDLSTWVTAIASVVSAIAAWRMWNVSKDTLNLQASVEGAKKPLIHIWYNYRSAPDGQTFGTFTFLNIGGSPLPIRTLQALFGSRQHGATIAKINAYTIQGTDKARIGLRHSEQELTDLILLPNQLCFVEVVLHSSQMTFQVMYYDNSFEFIEIDTSNLGGKYILTGQGRK